MAAVKKSREARFSWEARQDCERELLAGKQMQALGYSERFMQQSLLRALLVTLTPVKTSKEGEISILERFINKLQVNWCDLY